MGVGCQFAVPGFNLFVCFLARYISAVKKQNNKQKNPTNTLSVFGRILASVTGGETETSRLQMGVGAAGSSQWMDEGNQL